MILFNHFQNYYKTILYNYIQLMLKNLQTINQNQIVILNFILFVSFVH